MKNQSICKLALLSAISLFSLNHICAQCMSQVLHTSGIEFVENTQVTVSSFGHSDTITQYCPESTMPFLIGADYTTPNESGGFTFQFSPPIDSLTLNFSGINNDANDQEVIRLYINGNHYQIPTAGTENDCEVLALLTPEGDITGNETGAISGWNGTTITGLIGELTVLDSVGYGGPNGSVFSLFICGKTTSSISGKENLNVEVFPNPATDVLNIKGINSAKTEINLFDSLGRKLNIQPFIQSNEASIDVSSFSAGIYFITLYSINNITTHKIFIK